MSASGMSSELGPYESAKSQLPMLRMAAASSHGGGESDRGWMRGVDFYSPKQLPRVLTTAFMWFHAVHGRCPDLSRPKGFNDWIVRSNFLRPMKVPESGNKLLTSSFIPGRMAGDLRCPPIVWSGNTLNWPHLHQLLEAGQSYYLKASHGSSFYRRFTWPLDEFQAKELDTLSALWLETRFGLADGEWWYNVFPPTLIIERDVGGSGFSVNCPSFRGEVALVVLRDKATGEKITFGDQLQCLGHVNGQTDWRACLGEDVLREVRSLASGLSQDTEFARYDFLVGASGEIFLGEVTFAPSNGLARRLDGIDERLGRMWSESAAIRPR